MTGRRWLQAALLAGALLTITLTPGAAGWTLRLALGPGLAAALVGAVAGWLLAGVGYVAGDPFEQLASRLALALLALPPLALGPLLARGGLGGVLGALLWMRAWQSAALLLGQARQLGTERFVEAATALGASRARVYARHLGRWTLPAALAHGIEGAVLAAPFDLLFGLVGAGSPELGAPVAEALGRGDRGPLVAATAAGGVVAVALVTLAARVRRWASGHEGDG